MRDWLPAGHLVYFILDVVDGLDLSKIDKVYQDKDRRGAPSCSTGTGWACDRRGGSRKPPTRMSPSACSRAARTRITPPSPTSARLTSPQSPSCSWIFFAFARGQKQGHEPLAHGAARRAHAHDGCPRPPQLPTSRRPRETITITTTITTTGNATEGSNLANPAVPVVGRNAIALRATRSYLSPTKVLVTPTFFLRNAASLTPWAEVTLRVRALRKGSPVSSLPPAAKRSTSARR